VSMRVSIYVPAASSIVVFETSACTAAWSCDSLRTLTTAGLVDAAAATVTV
jgi:hypothetical protein